MKELGIELIELPDSYLYSVLHQSHFGGKFAPGNFDELLNMYPEKSKFDISDSIISTRFYLPSKNGNYVTYDINEFKICLCSSSSPELRKMDEKHYVVYVCGRDKKRNILKFKYRKTHANPLPVNEILGAVDLYNFGVILSRRVTIKRRG